MVLTLSGLLYCVVPFWYLTHHHHFMAHWVCEIFTTWLQLVVFVGFFFAMIPPSLKLNPLKAAFMNDELGEDDEER